MWRLRQNVQYNKRYLFKDIFSFVIAFHIIFFVVTFLYDSGKFHQERFVVNTQNLQSTIVFMPLKKRVVEQNKTVGNAQKKDGDRRKVINYVEYEKKLAAQNKAKKKSKQKEVKKKSSSTKAVETAFKKQSKQDIAATKDKSKKASTSLQHDKKKKVNKIESKKELPTVETKKTEEKKIVEKVVETQPVVEKKIEKEEIKAEAIVEKKIEEKQQVDLDKKVDEPNIPEAEPEQKDEKAEEIDNALTELLDEDLENVSFVGRHDLEAIHVKELIQAEVVKYYKPPIGIAKKTICELAVVVGAGGKAQRVTVKKKSGSIANDICARTALLKVTFPKEVIGKEIIVELGQ